MEEYEWHSEEKWKYHVEQWRSSGKTQKGCNQEGSTPVIFVHYWIYGKKGKEGARIPFLQFISKEH